MNAYDNLKIKQVTDWRNMCFGRLMGPLSSLLPLLVVAGLLYAALFVKPGATSVSVKPHAIERRDNFYGFAIPGDHTIWAVGSYGKVIRSDDDGGFWTVQPTPVRVHLQSIAAWDTDRAVAVGNDGVVILTGDGGRSWQQVVAPRSAVANKLVRVKLDVDGCAWAVGEMGAILTSCDDGANWRRTAKEEDLTWNDIGFVGRRIVVVGEFGRIRASEDRGTSWHEIASPIKTSLLAVSFRDPVHGVAVGLGGTVLVTDDGGSTWRAAPRATSFHLFDVTWDGTTWLAVGDKGVTVKSKEADTMAWTPTPFGSRDQSWKTQIEFRDGRYYFSGAVIGMQHDGRLRLFGMGG